jgi:hypothetical protein
MLLQCNANNTDATKKNAIPKELIRIATRNENDVETLRLREKRQQKKEKKKRMKVGRAGDWKCMCGAVVFASKHKCFKCGNCVQKIQYWKVKAMSEHDVTSKQWKDLCSG